MNEDINELFGDLRSMMTAGAPDPRELYWLLEGAHADDPYAYEDQWHGYLRHYSPLPLLITSLDELDKLTKLLPEGTEQDVTLSMVGHHLRKWHFQHIADSRASLFLRTLDVSDNQAENHYPAAFANTEYLVNLSTLRLANCRLHDFVARWILKAPFLASVRELDLSGNPLLTADIQELALNEAIQNVEALDLSNCGLDDAALTALVSSPHLGSLRALELSGNRFSREGFIAFARWPGLAQLESFDLPWSLVNLSTRKLMLASPYLSEEQKDFVFDKTIPKKPPK